MNEIRKEKGEKGGGMEEIEFRSSGCWRLEAPEVAGWRLRLPVRINHEDRECWGREILGPW